MCCVQEQSEQEACTIQSELLRFENINQQIAKINQATCEITKLENQLECFDTRNNGFFVFIFVFFFFFEIF